MPSFLIRDSSFIDFLLGIFEREGFLLSRRKFIYKSHVYQKVFINLNISFFDVWYPTKQKYHKYYELVRFLHKHTFGLITTSKYGIISLQEAYLRGVGGKILFVLYF